MTDQEFQRLAQRVLLPGRPFGHRQHVELAWLAVRHYGPDEATARFTEWLRHFAAAAGHPRKYHYTMSRAWVELIAHHVADTPAADFDTFVGHHPALLDTGLLGRHYSAAVLAGDAARRRWVEPDLAPFTWRAEMPG